MSEPAHDPSATADDDLVRTVVGMLPGPTVNADATVICEQPKLEPHRQEMERNLSSAIGAPVSVKATTNEGIGFIGSGEGVACLVVALLEVD